jgi:3-hydroxyisobutyrate dehydrogenase-like beta-hydroxyacid dehydrogenase
MSSISIIGLGSMARVLGTVALAGGSTVEVIGRDPAKAADLASALGGGATAGTRASACARWTPAACRWRAGWRGRAC